MADKDERARGRPSGHAHTTSAGSGGALSFLPNLFGRRPPTVATSRQASDSIRSADRRDSFDSPTSPKSSLKPLPLADNGKRAPSPSPAPAFHLQAAMDLMAQREGISEAELCEIIKATAVWIANLMLEQEGSSASEINAKQITNLYRQCVRLANPNGSRVIRTAAKRLLAALITLAPPGGGSGFVAVDFQDRLTAVSLYQVIISSASSTSPSISPSVEEIYVEVGALKALTKNGVEVDGTEGIVGWLVRTLQEMMVDWVKWCEKKEEEIEWEDTLKRRNTPFAPIKPASPADAAAAIVDLIAAIISAHASLFSFDDLRRIVSPIFGMLWKGASAELHSALHVQPETSTSARKGSVVSPISPSMPSLHALGMEPGLRRSISVKKSGRESISSPGPRQPNRQSSGSEPVQSPNLLSLSLGNIRSPSPAQTPVVRPKWSRLMVSFTAFFEILTKSVAIPTEVFKEAVAIACLVLGQDPDDGMALDAEQAASELIQLILGQAAGRRGENAVRMVLEGKTSTDLKLEVAKDSLVDLCMARGAVIASHTLLGYLDNPAASSDTPAMCAMASLTPSLIAAQSTSRFGKDMTAKHESWEPVDSAILGLLQTHLQRLSNMQTGEGKAAGDAWAEGQAACEVLEGLLPVVLASQQPNLRELRLATGASPTMAESEWGYRSWLERKTGEGSRPSLLLPLFEAVIHQLPRSIAHLHASTSTSPAFFHPRYIDLLIKLGAHLDEEDAEVVIDYYERECSCLPFTSGWTENIWKLIRAFFLSPSPLSVARKRVAKLLFTEIAGFAQDMPEYRVELVEKVLVPFLQQYLASTQDEAFQKEALAVLVNAAVAETLERDEERRQVRAQQAASTNAEEDASPEASREVTEATFAGSFNAIRALIAEIAHIPCKEDTSGIISPPMSESVSAASLSRSGSGKVKEPSLRALKGTISPPVRARELPSIASISGAIGTPIDEHTAGPPVPHQHHTDCRSIQAVLSLISIFTKLCFTPSFHNTQTTKAVRMPASFRSIIIFRDLLGLLYPMTDDRWRHTNTPVQVKIAARCPRARIVILEWLMRLRADNHHRLFVRQKIDEAALPFAAMLRRTKDTEAEGRAAEAEEARRRSRPSQQARPIEEDRGRASRSQESSTRSRSRSKAAPVVRGVDHTYNPLWILPQETLFEVPKNEQASEIMTTYNPSHPALQDPEAKPIDGVWLPVSQYVRVLNGILRGHDWELVSYVLCFLPLQLRNKLFFHGRRAVVEVRALLRVLADGVLGVDGNWEKRYNVPTFIKRVDINAIAYQSLSILIAYRGTMARDECDQLVQAFADGLQGRKDLAKPCLQALTLCIFELEQYVGRHLLIIIDRMERIVTTTALAVHILEFLIALGHNGSLYRNFTDEQYRRVFHIAIDYITIHNARSDEPIDLSKSREDYTLSQHVISLAYYSIYIWFLALKLPQRPNLVPEITRKLLQGRSKRVMVDEMAEVCFDWLSRYTYGNADPRPASSFLSEVVMKDSRESEAPKSVSWLLGGAILTITSHARSGWATITSTRPTGSTSVVCKLENVPLLEVGESNADLISLPAFLMANRDEIAKAASDLEKAEDLAKTKSTSAAEGFDASSQHGFIWSGATPSQRRKDVVIHPSYIGLQLLSSYPNQSLETPRGRLIPPEDKYQRALRGIHNTPVIDTVKIAVLYVAPGQTTETEILGNIDGSPLYLDFLSGIGRLIKLKGQVDVFVGGLNRDTDADGEYAYAWWDDFDQVIFHTPTMMPNREGHPGHEAKKRLVGNDFVKIVYNESGRDFQFDTIRTAWNFINVVVTPLTLGEGTILSEIHQPPTEDGWSDWDREEWFKVEIQKAPGIPDFGPLGEGKLVSRRSLPVMVRQQAHLANDLAARYMHIRDATDAASAEYISSWRSRLRAMSRLKEMMPKFDMPDQKDETEREELRRDFTRQFTYRPPAPEKQ